MVPIILLAFHVHQRKVSPTIMLACPFQRIHAVEIPRLDSRMSSWDWSKWYLAMGNLARRKRCLEWRRPCWRIQNYHKKLLLGLQTSMDSAHVQNHQSSGV